MNSLKTMANNKSTNQKKNIKINKINKITFDKNTSQIVK